MDTRAVEDVVMVEVTEVEGMEVTAVAEGEAAAEDEVVVVVVISQLRRVLLGLLGRLMRGTWPTWFTRQSLLDQLMHRPRLREFSFSLRTRRHLLLQVLSLLEVFLYVFCLIPGQPTAL